MVGELCCGHCYVSGGDMPDTDKSSPAGLLGADFVICSGMYRLSHILPSPNWHPEVTAPLDQPGLEVAAGDFLLAVNGRQLTPLTILSFCCTPLSF